MRLSFCGSQHAPKEPKSEPTENLKNMALLRHPRLVASSPVVSIDLVVTIPTSGYPSGRETCRIDGTVVEGSRRETSGEGIDRRRARKAATDALPDLLRHCRSAAIDSIGSEAVSSVLAAAEAWTYDAWPTILVPTTIATPRTDDRPLRLGRRVIHSHHLIGKNKRRTASELAATHRIGGYAKIGWPGIVVVKDDDEDCDRFVSDLRRLRWQYLAVRGEERLILPDDHRNASLETRIDATRKLPSRFVELGEDATSSLASLCREAGLEDLFLTCMKIYDRGGKRNDDEGDTSPTPPHRGVLVHVDHMNDPVRYRRWLHKACRTAQCDVRFGTYRPGRCPILLVGVIGRRDDVDRVLRRWSLAMFR